MTRDQAHDILNLARAGGLVPLHSITEALGVTGDLASHRREQSIISLLTTPQWPFYHSETGKQP